MSLEELTKQYNTSILVSQDIFELLSNEFKSYLRLVDRIRIGYSSEIFNIYSPDIMLEKLRKQKS